MRTDRKTSRAGPLGAHGHIETASKFQRCDPRGVNSPSRTRHRLLGLKVLSVGPKTLSFTLNVPMLGS